MEETVSAFLNAYTLYCVYCMSLCGCVGIHHHRRVQLHAHDHGSAAVLRQSNGRRQSGPHAIKGLTFAAVPPYRDLHVFFSATYNTFCIESFFSVHLT